jgi:hypothetical protein
MFISERRHRIWGPHGLLSNGYWVSLPKCAAAGAWSWLQYSAEVKDACSSTATLPSVFIVWCWTDHRNDQTVSVSCLPEAVMLPSFHWNKSWECTNRLRHILSAFRDHPMIWRYVICAAGILWISNRKIELRLGIRTWGSPHRVWATNWPMELSYLTHDQQLENTA